MGLRCSLLGHAFDEPVTERDREKRGAEVLITVREVRRCSRCDAEQVITENKEIRHLGSEDEGGPDSSPSRQASPETTPGADRGPAQPGEESGDPESERTTERAAEPHQEIEAPSEPDETRDAAGGRADAPDSESDTGEVISDTDDQREEEAEDQAESDIEVSKYVDAAEGPDAGGPGGSPGIEEPAESEVEEPESASDEDVEIIDGDAEEASPESDHGTEETETAPPESGPQDHVEEPGSADIDEEPARADATQEAAATDADQEETRPEDTDAGSPSEDTEPPDDDAIILDNDEGKDARESEVGRQEVAGSGNMFDPSAPENEEAESPRSRPSLREDAESDSEVWPGREVEGRDSDTMEGDAETGDQTEWPTSESVDEADEVDSTFQFGRDMLADEEPPHSGETPSGLTSEGPVDVAGDPDDSPPKTVECPECGHTTEGVGSSLRAGDICPECHDAYLTYRR